MPNLDLAKQILSDWRRSKRQSDLLSQRPRIAEQHAISRNIQESRARAALGLNDILESIGATALLDDPDLRDKLHSIARKLNGL